MLSVPTMLSVEERQLLYGLARDYVCDGAIVDAGCFLGGSTVALAAGLSTSREDPDGPPIHTYDLFELDAAYKRDYPGLVDGIEVGGSMRPRFEQVVGPLLQRVEVHEGDICAESWPGDPIDVLFIDICKSWEINDHVVREFFPALVPGRSIVIQQDLIHEWLPFLTITMGLFRDSFELIDAVPYCSAVYLNTRAISQSAIPPNLDALPGERKLELFDEGCAPFSGEYRGVIECSRAVLFVNLGRKADATSHLADVMADYQNNERVQHVAGLVEGWVAAQSNADH